MNDTDYQHKPWTPTKRELLIPFIGTQAYASRWTAYFNDRKWSLMSPTEMREKENPSFANSEQRITWKNYSRVGWCLTVKDTALFIGLMVGGLTLLDRILR
jgi:hypothetical protein